MNYNINIPRTFQDKKKLNKQITQKYKQSNKQHKQNTQTHGSRPSSQLPSIYFTYFTTQVPTTQCKPHPTPTKETNNTKAKSHRAASGVSGSRIKNTITINTKRQSQISINCFVGKGISHIHIHIFDISILLFRLQYLVQ